MTYNQGPVWPPPPTGSPPPSSMPPYLDPYAFKPLWTLRTMILVLAIPTLIIELTKAFTRGHYAWLNAYVLVVSISSLLSLVSEVVDILWLYRAYKNIQVMSFDRTRFVPWVAALSILIPFVNLVISVMVFMEIWNRSEPWPSPPSNRAPAAIPIWWALIMVAYVADWLLTAHIAGSIALATYVICRTVTKIMTMVITNALTTRIHHRQEGMIAAWNQQPRTQPWG